jgi:hypothetical protein
MRKTIFIKTTSVPPKNLPIKSWVREIGFDKSKSILPFSSIMGIKLDEENIASNKHKFANGAVIINWIFATTSSRKTLFPEGFIPEIIDSVSIKLKIIASPTMKISEMTAKKINTLRAKASLNVYEHIIIILFIFCYTFLPH